MNTHNSSTILLFYSYRDPLSNFFPSPFIADNVIWPTVEHYYQAHKFDNASSEGQQHRELVRLANGPTQAKHLGYMHSELLYPDWSFGRRDQVMRTALWHKFTQSLALANYLIGTGSQELAENSPTDRYWGLGRDGLGQNRLGEYLMELRFILLANLVTLEDMDHVRTTYINTCTIANIGPTPITPLPGTDGYLSSPTG